MIHYSANDNSSLFLFQLFLIFPLSLLYFYYCFNQSPVIWTTSQLSRSQQGGKIERLGDKI